MGWRNRAAMALLAAAWTALGIGAAHADAAADQAVFGYQGADRMQRLVDGARAEKTLTFYTSNAPADANLLKSAFEQKYAITVALWRGLAGQVVQRSMTEARAHRYAVDVVEGNATEIEMLAQQGLTARFFSPELTALAPWAVPQHHLWVADRAEMYGVGFNTGTVQRADLPKTYEGFLDPKWQGKLAVEGTSEDLLATICQAWGEARGMAFFRKLAAMKPEFRPGHALFGQLIAAGEVQVGIGAYYNSLELAKRQGAPVDWAPVEPVVVRPQALAVAANAPHPHAALLFVDFLLSAEGQKLIRSRAQLPSNRTVASPLDGISYVMEDPAALLASAAKWHALWNGLFQ